MVALHVLDAPILGPPFTHQHLKALRSYHIGSTVPRDNPSYFLQCISELIKIWRTDFGEKVSADAEELVPLVINTCGWIKNMGLDLLVSVVQEAKPTDIFVLYNEDKDNDILTDCMNETLNVADYSPVVHNIPSVSIAGTFASSYTAFEHRVLATISYFHQKLNNYGTLGTLWWDFESRMIERVPWQVDWRKGIDGVWILYEDVPLSQLLYTLNGSIVALIGKVEDGEEIKGPCNPVEDDASPETVSDTNPPSGIHCKWQRANPTILLGSSYVLFGLGESTSISAKHDMPRPCLDPCSRSIAAFFLTAYSSSTVNAWKSIWHRKRQFWSSCHDGIGSQYWQWFWRSKYTLAKSALLDTGHGWRSWWQRAQGQTCRTKISSNVRGITCQVAKLWCQVCTNTRPAIFSW